MLVQTSAGLEERRTDYVVVVEGVGLSHAVPELHDGDIVAHTIDGQCIVMQAGPTESPSRQDRDCIHCDGVAGHWGWR